MDIKAYIAQYPGNEPATEKPERYPIPGNIKRWSEDREDMVYGGRVTIGGKHYDVYFAIDREPHDFDHNDETHPVQIAWTYLVTQDGSLEAMMSNVYTMNFTITD